MPNILIPRLTLATLFAASIALSACANSPKDTKAQDTGAQASGSEAASNEQRYQNALKKGYTALQAGDLEGAQVEFKLASLLNPESPYPYINMGVVAQTRGNLAAARNYYELAKSLPTAGDISPTQQASAGAMQNATPRAIAEANLRNLDQAARAALAAPVVKSVVEPKPVAVVQVPTPPPAVVKPTVLYTADELNGLIANWKKAWSSKDLNTYINLYATEYAGYGGSAPKWRAARGDMFNPARTIDLQVGQPTYTQLTSDTVQADFTQSYNSGVFKDKGAKRMVLRKAAGEWKIISEVFTAAK